MTQRTDVSTDGRHITGSRVQTVEDRQKRTNGFILSHTVFLLSFSNVCLCPLPYVICLLSSAVCPLPFVLCHLSSTVCSLLCPILTVICHLHLMWQMTTAEDRCQRTDVRRQMSDEDIRGQMAEEKTDDRVHTAQSTEG